MRIRVELGPTILVEQRRAIQALISPDAETATIEDDVVKQALIDQIQKATTEDLEDYAVFLRDMVKK